MKIREMVVKGENRMIIVRSASGEDKVKEAILKVMGPTWEYKNTCKKIESLSSTN